MSRWRCYEDEFYHGETVTYLSKDNNDSAFNSYVIFKYPDAEQWLKYGVYLTKDTIEDSGKMHFKNWTVI